MNIKIFLSYLIPINKTKIQSDISGEVTIYLKNGKWIVDTPKANYSNGRLQNLLVFALSKIRQTLKQKNQILILGLGNGGILTYLYPRVSPTANFTAIEIDEVMIDLAKKHLTSPIIDRTLLINEDAKTAIYSLTSVYNLIIIDLFVHLQMPEFLNDEKFVHRIFQLINKNGAILLNTIPAENSIFDFAVWENSAKHYDFTIIKLNKLDGINDIYIFEKT